MEARLDYAKLAPSHAGAVLARRLPREVRPRAPLLELVKIRASQINGCAYCIDMHTKDARAAGETEQRMYALSAWRETPFFSDRERAALAWTEAVTRIGDGVTDALFDEARGQFSEKELTDLTWAVAVINAWNRVAISFRSVPGAYQPKNAGDLRTRRPRRWGWVVSPSLEGGSHADGPGSDGRCDPGRGAWRGTATAT